jgi:hypothetical protein
MIENPKPLLIVNSFLIIIDPIGVLIIIAAGAGHWPEPVVTVPSNRINPIGVE